MALCGAARPARYRYGVDSSVVRTLISLELRLLLTVSGLNEDFRSVVVWVESNVFLLPFTGYPVIALFNFRFRSYILYFSVLCLYLFIRR